MILTALAALTALSAVPARATASASRHFSNVSLGGGQVVVATPAPKPGIAPAPPVPVAAAPTPPPRPPAAPIWPETAVAAAFVFGVAALSRSRDSKRDRAAGETLALAAHELKSPLSAIESYLDLMAQGAPEDARGVREWLSDVRRMKSTASHLRRTIGDILDMTRIEDGRLKLSPRPLHLGPLLNEVAAEYAALARKRKVSVSVSAEAGLPAAVADPDRLRQVLHNLLGNALKFTPSGRSVRLSAACEGGHLFVDVSDEGVGVPLDKREKLFGKFARLGPAVDATEGTGLGLYISRRLVEAQGGKLTYAPRSDGRGSLFRVTLPGAAVPA
ncbi:MAG: sensor histidine kinase [Elusimicrobiota bacterium]